VVVTGVAPPIERLCKRSILPPNDLVHLAAMALKAYKTEHLITSLEPGWEQALAKAAVEFKIPYTVTVPYAGRDRDLRPAARVLYNELLARANKSVITSGAMGASTLFECRCWQIDNSDLLLALWDFNFQGELFDAIRYALKKGLTVANHWMDWQSFHTLREDIQTDYAPNRPKGAQVF
jgi:hypothetical protein